MAQQDVVIADQGESVAQAFLPSRAWQTGVGVVVMLCAALWGLGVLVMPSTTSWMGSDARLLPFICALVLMVCGTWLVWEARHGGWRNASTLSGYAGLQVTPWIWVSTGGLLGGSLVGVLGFITAGAVCYALALQGLRLAADVDARNSGKRWCADLMWGVTLAVFISVLFTQVIGIALPKWGWPWM